MQEQQNNSSDTAAVNKLKHPQSPAEQQKGNMLPEDLHTTVKPVPDPIPVSKEKENKQVDN